MARSEFSCPLFLEIRLPPSSTLFPTRRSSDLDIKLCNLELIQKTTGFREQELVQCYERDAKREVVRLSADWVKTGVVHRSEEHTSELQSQSNLVCRLLLEKKNNNYYKYNHAPY